MTKNETIVEILRLNRSADAEFLCEFSEEQLAGYLERLAGASSASRPAWEAPKSSKPNVHAVAGAA